MKIEKKILPVLAAKNEDPWGMTHLRGTNSKGEEERMNQDSSPQVIKVLQNQDE